MNKVYTQINVRLAPELLERVQIAAQDSHTSTSAWIVKALEEKLEREEK
jgi:predicted HicB family RNase H-like nuclease